MKLYLVWCEDYGQTSKSGREIEAADEDQAAESWADLEDSDGDYAIIGGSDAVLHVREVDGPDDHIWMIRVSGQAEPVYTARKVA